MIRTIQQQRLFDFIRSEIGAGRAFPSVDEISASVGYADGSTARQAVERLVEIGVLTKMKIPGKHRLGYRVVYSISEVNIGSRETDRDAGGGAVTEPIGGDAVTVHYADFIAGKIKAVPPSGFDPVLPMPAATKPFQADIITWACRRGRAAVFAGTGLGKTLMELTWAANVAAKTGGQVLIFTPLAVAEQTVQEAAKFGIQGVAYAADESEIKGPITVTNYDRRDKFDLSQFAGVALDESGIIKDHDSKTRTDLTDACRDTPYLFCGSATPAPNDWTSSANTRNFSA